MALKTLKKKRKKNYSFQKTQKTQNQTNITGFRCSSANRAFSVVGWMKLQTSSCLWKICQKDHQPKSNVFAGQVGLGHAQHGLLREGVSGHWQREAWGISQGKTQSFHKGPPSARDVADSVLRTQGEQTSQVLVVPPISLTSLKSSNRIQLNNVKA
jgi:hypothetical protein